MNLQSIAHYRILSRLGAGGMGEVYLAEDTRLNRKVAIKFLPENSVSDPQAKKRLIREAQSAATLDHPHICSTYEIGEEGGRIFIVMQYVDGETLADRIQRSPIALGELLEIGVQVADALAEAHSRGIIHRDIKPANIMLTEGRQVKVMDFGLAKNISTPTALESAAETQSQLTEPGMIIGTAPYMSPEQVAGKAVTTQSDIFSFGALLYEMAAGKRAFGADSQMGTLAAILNQEPEPLPGTVPPDLAKVIVRCLRKEPARRYQTMADLKVALEDLHEETLAPTRKSRTHAPLRWVWITSFILVIAAALVGIIWQRQSSPNVADAFSAVPLTTLTGAKRYPSFSPDGTYIAFTWSGEKQHNPDIYIQQIGSGSPSRRTTDPGNDSNPAWSPDGHLIAFLRSKSESGTSDLMLIPPVAGPERKLAEIRIRGGTWVTPPYLAWCPDNNCVVVTDSQGEDKLDALFKVSIETGEKTVLTDPQPPAIGDCNPAITPDGRWMVFRRSYSLFNGELYVLPLGKDLTPAGEPQRLTAATFDAAHPTCMPDSKEIIFSAKRTLWRMAIAAGNTPRRLPFVGEDGMTPVVSRGQAERQTLMAYVRSLEDSNIWRVETGAQGATATSSPVVLIASSRYDGMASLSPDGRRVAFSSNRSGEGEIWLADSDGANPTKLTSTGAAIATGYPRWSPDGRMIAFHSNFEGQPDVYVIAASGGKPRNLTSHPATDGFPSFSQDSQWVYFSSNRLGQHIWKVPIAGGEAIQVTQNGGYAPAESPDGAYIYYVETLDKPSQLWRVPVSGGDPEKLLDDIVLANFVVLDKGIYYIDKPSGQGGVHYLDSPSGETRLQYFDFTKRRSTTIARNLGQVDFPLTVSPDGRTILYTRMDASIDDLMLVKNFR